MNLSEYKIPEALKEYLEESRSAQSRITEPILLAIEETYTRLKAFYIFSEAEFSNIVAVCLPGYRTEDSFSYYLEHVIDDRLQKQPKRTDGGGLYDTLIESAFEVYKALTTAAFSYHEYDGPGIHIEALIEFMERYASLRELTYELGAAGYKEDAENLQTSLNDVLIQDTRRRTISALKTLNGFCTGESYNEK